MKKAIIISIGIISLILICFFAGRTSVTVPAAETKQQKIVDTLRVIDKEKEFTFNKKLDSVTAENAAIKSANNLIEYSITKIITTNEKNKIRSVSANDSLKHFISDSLLRANGYK